MRERVDDRHERILQLVREQGSFRITDLAAALGISPETTRRDVIALADVGRLRRIHGKVYWPTAALNARDARLAQRVSGAPSPPVMGMIVPIPDYFYQEIIHGARAAATAVGARLLIGSTDYGQEGQDAQQISIMLKAGVDGLLLSPSWGLSTPSAADWEPLERLEIPVVLVERRLPVGHPGASLDRVCADHAEGAAAAVRHLADLGHARVALLTCPSYNSEHIRHGYRAAVRALGLPEDDVWKTGLNRDPGSYEPLEAAVSRLAALIESDGVRAAIVHNDREALNVLHHLKARGVRVPEDFALVTHDDELATIADVPLTAVAPPKRTIGETAANLLLRRIADPATQRTHIDLLPELRIRESSGVRTPREETV